MTTALTDHVSRVETWADEQGQTISAPKSTITLFTPETEQSPIHPHATLNSSLLPLEKRPSILGVTFNTNFNFTEPIDTIITCAFSRQHSQGPCRYHTIWFSNASGSMIQKLQSPNYPIFYLLRSYRLREDDFHQSIIYTRKPKCFLSTITFPYHASNGQYLARPLQSDNHSHSAVTSPSDI